jgi:hypothetical protein
MVSDNSQPRPRAALDALTAAFGQPAPTPAGRLRWAVPRGESGRQIVIDLATGPTQQETVWVFNPEASSVAAVYSYDVSTREGLASLRHELHRIHLKRGSFHPG